MGSLRQLVIGVVGVRAGGVRAGGVRARGVRARAFGARVMVACVMSAALVTGCSGPDPIVTETPSPTPSESVTPSATTSATPSPSPTALSAEELLDLLPPNAGQPDLLGAVVTAEFFLEQLGTIYTTGNTTLWEALAGDGCEYCALKEAEVRQLNESDWRAEGGAVTVDESLTRAGVADDGHTYVKVIAQVDDLYVVDAVGEREMAEAASQTEFGLRMVFDSGVWRIDEVSLDDAS